MSLKTRAITGLSFAAIMALGIGLSYYSCAILFLLVTAVCLWELSGHILVQDGTNSINTIRQGLFIGVGLLFPVLTLLTFIFDVQNAFQLGIFFPVIAFGLFLFELLGKSKKPFNNIAFMFLGIVYIAMPFSLLMHLASPYFKEFEGEGNLFVLATILMVWASDSCAYMLGSRIGRNKMFPRISPNKTWEGTLSGVAGALITGFLCSQVFTVLDFPLVFWIGLACICTIMGILGDLVESMFKRSIGIKDSGNLLPGHGGFLDRFDAFLFVIPFVYVYVVVWFKFLT